MLLDAVLQRFVERTPLAVAVRGTLEYALAPADLDALFDRAAGPRADRELLFSTCVDLMAAVVCRVKPSIHAAYQADDRIPVSVAAVYARLARVPTAAGRDLVRHTADRLGPVLRALGGVGPDRLPGYRVKILDGNHLGKTERRLTPLRDVAAGPLPGQTLVVLDPALGLAIDAIVCEDAHAQERSLLGPILETVADRDVWIADRNFCTTGFLFGVAARGGFFVIRRHAVTLSWDRETGWRSAGRSATGELTEQTIWLAGPGGAELAVRRVRVTLDRPTRGGDAAVEVLTNLPIGVAGPAVVAELYRGRWTVEGLFLRLTTVLKCEVNTLGYPPAALFGFCVALAAGNAYAGVTAALAAVHGVDVVAEGVSDYHVAVEVAGVAPGLAVAVPEEAWAGIGGWSVEAMAGWLIDLASRADLGRYRKAARGPKKPQPARTRFSKAGHIATDRLLRGKYPKS
jgi:hypothetical protein